LASLKIFPHHRGLSKPVVSFVTIKAVKAIVLIKCKGISLILFYNKKPHKCGAFLSLSLK
jgi:hypothetical protein